MSLQAFKIKLEIIKISSELHLPHVVADCLKTSQCAFSFIKTKQASAGILHGAKAFRFLGAAVCRCDRKRAKFFPRAGRIKRAQYAGVKSPLCVLATRARTVVAFTRNFALLRVLIAAQTLFVLIHLMLRRLKLKLAHGL